MDTGVIYLLRLTDLEKTPMTNDALLDEAQRLYLLNAEQRAAASKLSAEELRRRGWLTAFQFDRLRSGRGAELLLGSYVLVEKLGEGGMGGRLQGQAPEARQDHRTEAPSTRSGFLHRRSSSASCARSRAAACPRPSAHRPRP